jgi:hypothetical protein
MSSTLVSPGHFGTDNFAAARLGDRRRTASLVDLADRLARHPGGSLPEKFGDPLALRRCYDLMNTQAVTHAAVLKPHGAHAFAKIRDATGVVLFLHDTTELDYTGLTSLHDHLGQIGGGGHGRGYECHNCLAVAASGHTVFGLVNQILHCRADVPKDETAAQARERESRESLLWLKSVEPLPLAPADRCWVDVCDRGGDTFEFLSFEEHLGRKFLVRSKSNRCIRVGHDGQGRLALLHTHLRTLPALAQRTVTIHDHDNGSVRSATVNIAYAAVRIGKPRNQRGYCWTKFVDVWAIRVWESNPPAGVEAVEWFLLTNVPLTNVADAWERVDWYLQRWIIEELHKAQKTGCSVEEPQFTTVAALQPMIALLSVVAVLLLNLRQLARDEATATLPATEVVSEVYVSVLSLKRYGVQRPLTVREFILALGRLGGHQNRRRDGLPGWLVLWRGWTKLQLLVEGFLVAQKTQTKKHSGGPKCHSGSL